MFAELTKTIADHEKLLVLEKNQNSKYTEPAKVHTLKKSEEEHYRYIVNSLCTFTPK